MPTLLEIYESHINGQKKQFMEQVREYGVEDFCDDMKTEVADGVLTETERAAMLHTIAVLGV